MNIWKRKLQRFCAFWLSAVVLITGIPVSALAENGSASYLDGWTVQAAWSTFSDRYEWNAQEEEVRQPKLVVTYRMDHAQKDYPAGSLTFKVPGIGAADRSRIVKASHLAADEADSEWNYEWNQEQDIYIFTNRFMVETGQSVSGGFELLWNLDARNLEDGYERTENPVFSVSDVGQIELNPVTFQFTSVKDRYRIALSRDKLYDEAYEAADEGYIWYEFTTRFDKDWMSRGLYKSDYYVTVELPEEQEPENVVVQYGGDTVELVPDTKGRWGFYPFQGRNGDLGGAYYSHYDSFTLGFEKETMVGQEITIHGHLDRLYHDEGEWVRKAGENEVVDAELTFTVEDYHFDYTGYIYDHDKWNTEYENYSRSPGYYTHAYGDEQSHGAPPVYGDRLNAVNLYNGKIVQFTLRGKANRSYAAPQAAAYGLRRMSATPSDAGPESEPIPESIADWNDIRWQEHGLGMETLTSDGRTYGEQYPQQTATWSDARRATSDAESDEIFLIPDIVMRGVSGVMSWIRERNPFQITAFASVATPGNVESDTEAVTARVSSAENDEGLKTESEEIRLSGIGEDQEYSLVLGDDKLAVFLNDGSIRNLEDHEYDMSYVTIPSDNCGYDYEVYGADAQDAMPEEYVLVGSGNTAGKQTIHLPDGIKAMFVRVNGITGTYLSCVYVGVRLHLDWSEQQELDESQRPDHENRLVNFSYLRALYLDEEGYEHNDCVTDEGSYGGTYGDELAEMDETLYGEYLERDYSNVWLRSAVTSLASAVCLEEFTGGDRAGFTSAITSEGTIQADNIGSLERFSVYTVLPDGLLADPDEAEIVIEGQAYDIFGGEVTELSDYAMISSGEYQGKRVLKADFDCSGRPLEISKLTHISMTIPVTLSYADYLEYGSQYTAKCYFMVHDDGIDRISGKAVMSDEYDMDQDGITDEKMAYAAYSARVSDYANEWREYVSKSIRSAYSEDYVTDTVTRIYSESDDAETQEKSRYTYRLEFGLGSDHARSIIFYDRLEQGAVLQVDSGAESEEQILESQWQGEFVSVDTSYAVQMGMIPTVYYSENPQQELNLNADGWSTGMPADRSLVKSIAVMLDTSQMEDGMMKMQQMTYITVHMRAPSDRSFCDKKAVNQYTVQYDAYGLSDLFEQTYRLSSAETTVRLLDTVGKIVLQKVDADHVIRTGDDGIKQYSSLTGAKFQVYDSDGNALFSEPQKLSSLGRIPVKNVPYGTYYWEEVEAPPGYERITGLHAFEIDGITEILEIPNHRIPGKVTLVKKDQDSLDEVRLSGAVYELYEANGNQVFTDENYVWKREGANSTFVTDESGQLIVTGLPWGSYYFREIEAPTGYILASDHVNFTIGKGQYDGENGIVQTEVVAYNSQKTASLTLKKTDEINQKPIKDAIFSLYRSDTEEDQLMASGLKTNAAGEIVVNDLKFGTYYFVETRNAGGYQMPDEKAARTESVVLNASTAEQMLEIGHTNERRSGRVWLTKTDNTGMLAGDAEYGLYYRESEQEEYRLMGTYTTEADRNSPSYGEILVEDLPWGDYYFLETRAPKGYELSTEPIAFTIDRETVQNVISLEATDWLKDGSVRLIKTDLEDPNVRLPGAVYELYRLDGTRCVAGVDYSLPEGITRIETGEDGSILLMDISQGAYYLQEIQAPDSYSISDELIRFSVTKENVDAVQELVAADEKGKAVITIRKEINEIYEAFGNPTFLFQVTGEDGSRYVRSITMDGQNLTGEVSLEVDQGVIYTVGEMQTARYRLQEVIPGTNAVLEADGATVKIDLTTEVQGQVTFVNRMDQYEKFSHTGHAANLVSDVTKLTAVSVEYHGISPITVFGDGYDEDTEDYTIAKSDLTVLAHYDDGTTEEIPAQDYTLSPETVNGLSDSYTGTVSYTEDGITRTAAFSVEIDLPKPLPRYTAAFELNGGTIIPDGESSAQEQYRCTVKSGTQITEPANEPVLEGYWFKGWFEDEALMKEAIFPQTVDSDRTYYAKWEEICVEVRYAVSIYGIQEDTDVNGKVAGLTFGPATGARYVSSSKSHEPIEEGQICMHDLSWSQIIEHSRTNPTVFRECLEQGCTHAVPLKIKGPLMEGGTTYRDMTGDGAGMLYNALNPDYLKWNRENSTYFTDTDSYEYRYGANLGGWPDSAMRNTLNGTVTDNMLSVSNKENGFSEAKLDESTALIAWFPQELRDAIVAKKVRSDTVYNDTSNYNVTTYDKLWLFSGIELTKNAGIGDGRNSIRPNEGTLYSRQDVLGITTAEGTSNIAYREDGEVFNRWTRTLYPSYIAAYNAFMVNQTGYLKNNSVRSKYGIAPGFCLPGPDADGR